MVVYATTEGHTRKIADFVANEAAQHGFEVEVVDSGDLPHYLNVGQVDAFILAGSLHQTKHQDSLVKFVRDHKLAIQSKPSAFLSVSLTAVIKDEEHRAAANKCIGGFIEETGWMPSVTLPVAGALKYTQYDYLKRMLMRMIAKSEGGDVDTSQDYEYTDWEELRSFVHNFLVTHAKTAQVA